MGLSLNKRPCTLGTINTRVENHGDDEVPAADIAISGIMLDKTELCELLDDQYAYAALFNLHGKMVEPMFKRFAPFALKDSYEKSGATIFVGLDSEAIRFTGVRLRRITLAPQPGGLTAMSIQVQTTPDAEQIAELFQHMRRTSDCSLRFGKLEVKDKAQPELPLGDEPERLGPDEVAGPLDEQPVA